MSVGIRPNTRHFFAAAGEKSSLQGTPRVRVGECISEAKWSSILKEALAFSASSAERSCTWSTTNVSSIIAESVTRACWAPMRGGSRRYEVKLSMLQIAEIVYCLAGAW